MSRVFIFPLLLLAISAVFTHKGEDAQSAWASPALAKEPPVAEPENISLKKLPSLIPPAKYRVDPYIEAAAKLRAAGKDKAVEVLRAAIKDCETPDAIFVLCRMLFTAKPKGDFRRPLIGAPFFLGGSRLKDWPLEPIEIVDGVPFLIVDGYLIAGLPESPEKYLDYCLKDCAWGTTDFKARTADEKKKVLEKLLSSKKWKKPPERRFLACQIK